MDEEAWLELCDMYLAKQNFQKAQYCFEELIAVNPLNYQHNLRYAEILYSQAVANQNSLTLLELARKYYSHALVLIDDVKDKKHVHNNVARALWGLLKVCKTLNQIQKKGDPKNTEVLQITHERLTEIYS